MGGRVGVVLLPAPGVSSHPQCRSIKGLYTYIGETEKRKEKNIFYDGGGDDECFFTVFFLVHSTLIVLFCYHYNQYHHYIFGIIQTFIFQYCYQINTTTDSIMYNLWFL